MRLALNQKRAGLAWLMGLVGAVVAITMVFGMGRGGTARAQDEEAHDRGADR